MNKINEIKPGLYLGNLYNVKKKTDAFDALNIDVIINCCDEYEHKEHKNEKYTLEQFPINDDGLDDSFITYMDVAADTIKNHMDNQKNIYVHCVQGVSRSVAIVIYYLMKYEKMSYDKAYVTVLLERSCISPHPNFVSELKKREIAMHE